MTEAVMYEPITAEQLPANAAAPDLDGILRRINPRIYHLYKHAKKARARKKNYHRLMKELHRWLN